MLYKEIKEGLYFFKSLRYRTFAKKSFQYAPTCAFAALSHTVTVTVSNDVRECKEGRQGGIVQF